MTRRLHIVDVFTERAGAGHALAVVLGAHGLTSRQMQLLAREMNYSITSFVVSAGPEGGAWPVRLYSPSAELAFAGHPALGTAHVLRQSVFGGASERLCLEFGDGRVPVVMERVGRHELYWMAQPRPSFGARLPRRSLASVLGLAPADLDANKPALEVRTGLAHLVVPVRTRQALDRIALDAAAAQALLAPLAARSIVAFAPGARTAQHQYTVRVFAAASAVAEDPGTGSGNGCLAAWLIETGAAGDDPLDVRVEQGAHLMRPSTVYLRAMRTSQGIEVRVGGGVADVARGVIVAPMFS